MFGTMRCAFVILLAAICCPSANAQLYGTSHTIYKAYRCENCTTDQDWEQKALGVPHLGLIHLYNFEQDEIRAYYRTHNPRGGASFQGGEFDIMVSRATIDSSVADGFEGAHTVWARNDHTLHVDTDRVSLSPYSPSVPAWLREASAFDLAMVEANRYRMETWMLEMAESAFEGDLGSVAAFRFIQNVGNGSWAHLIFGENPFAWQLVIHMPQGGTVLMKINAESARLWEYVEARDDNGNRLPEKIHDISGIYRFDESYDSWDDFQYNPWHVPWPEMHCELVACVGVPVLRPGPNGLQSGEQDLQKALQNLQKSGTTPPGGSPTIQMETDCYCV